MNYKWLSPHLELVKKLENTSDENEAKKIILRLQKSNEIYHIILNNTTKQCNHKINSLLFTGYCIG